LLLCGLLFLLNGAEEGRMADRLGILAPQIAMTPLQQKLFFDYPASAQILQKLVETVPIKTAQKLSELSPEAQALIKQSEEVPSWRGVYALVTTGAKGPLFGKIREGELWRLLTPALLHRDFLHILFNMVWAWMLIKQVEARLSKGKVCALIVLIGIGSNGAQYLMSGPYFLGFSGVVVGLAGFIWMRQRIAPWEGYPLQKGTTLFLLFFVLALCALELISFFIQLVSPLQVFPHIANTAHVIGGVIGLWLGKTGWFSRRRA
jgi:GlpG protein